jgi:hypothetical protein
VAGDGGHDVGLGHSRTSAAETPSHVAKRLMGSKPVNNRLRCSKPVNNRLRCSKPVNSPLKGFSTSSTTIGPTGRCHLLRSDARPGPAFKAFCFSTCTCFPPVKMSHGVSGSVFTDARPDTDTHTKCTSTDARPNTCLLVYLEPC